MNLILTDDTIDVQQENQLQKLNTENVQLKQQVRMVRVEPLPAQELKDDELVASILSRPKKELESEIRRLVADLSALQNHYDRLDKRSVAGQSSLINHRLFTSRRSLIFDR
jgi:hypothetical protein